MYEFTVGFIMCIIGYLTAHIALKLTRRTPKVITRDVFINKYNDFQKFHINEFKKVINNDLQAYIKAGQKLPIQITYQNVFSEQSLLDLKDYILKELKFTNFELEQRDDISLRLILK